MDQCCSALPVLSHTNKQNKKLKKPAANTKANFVNVYYNQFSPALQRDITEKLKQIFPEKELRSLSPNFHIHVSVSDLYIPRIGPHIFL
jgi:hypothetical protein